MIQDDNSYIEIGTVFHIDKRSFYLSLYDKTKEGKGQEVSERLHDGAAADV